MVLAIRYIVDLDGFNVKGHKFIAKEMAVLDTFNGEIKSFYFKVGNVKDYKFNDKQMKTINYVTKYVHGLKFKDYYPNRTTYINDDDKNTLNLPDDQSELPQNHLDEIFKILVRNCFTCTNKIKDYNIYYKGKEEKDDGDGDECDNDYEKDFCDLSTTPHFKIAYKGGIFEQEILNRINYSYVSFNLELLNCPKFDELYYIFNTRENTINEMKNNKYTMNVKPSSISICKWHKTNINGKLPHCSRMEVFYFNLHLASIIPNNNNNTLYC